LLSANFIGVKVPLSRRPTHRATAQQMVMQMEHRLSGMRAAIDYHTKTFFGDSQVLGQFRGYTKNLPDNRSIFRTEIQNRSDMFSWHDQNVHRRLGTDILKSDHIRILVNQFPLDFSLYNAAKKTVFHRTSSGQRPWILRTSAPVA